MDRNRKARETRQRRQRRQFVTKQVLFSPEGTARFIHDDGLMDVAREMGGDISVSRASHVEPTADGRWTADLGPVGGPVLGPYDHRSDALRDEHDWLLEHGIPTCAPCAANPQQAS